jgi:hypothetical protein
MFKGKFNYYASNCSELMRFDRGKLEDNIFPARLQPMLFSWNHIHTIKVVPYHSASVVLFTVKLPAIGIGFSPLLLCKSLDYLQLIKYEPL